MALIHLFLVALMVCHGSSNAVGLQCSSAEDVIQNINLFTSNAVKHLEKNGNFLFCPLSFSLAFLYLTCGAQSQTKDELRDVFYINNNYNNTDRCCDYKCGVKNLLQLLEGDALKIVTRLFLKNGIQIRPGFLKLGQTYFNSTVQQVDFSNSTTAADIVNEYVKKNTNNKINGIIKPGSIKENTLLILVNALHFQSDWLNIFKTEYYDYWYPCEGGNVTTKMMAITGQFNYKELPNAQVLILPFKKKDYTMIFILPTEKSCDMEFGTIDYSPEHLTSGVDLTYVKVVLPIFQMEETIDGKQLCQKLGIERAFSDKAELNCIVENKNVSVTDAIQKTTINVTKTGVEATAATAITVGVTSVVIPPETTKQFIANRPFIYLICYKNLTIFIGQLKKV